MSLCIVIDLAVIGGGEPAPAKAQHKWSLLKLNEKAKRDHWNIVCGSECDENRKLLLINIMKQPIAATNWFILNEMAIDDVDDFMCQPFVLAAVQ